MGLELEVKLPVEVIDGCKIKGFELACKLNEIVRLMIWNHKYTLTD